MQRGFGHIDGQQAILRVERGAQQRGDKTSAAADVGHGARPRAGALAEQGSHGLPEAAFSVVAVTVIAIEGILGQRMVKLIDTADQRGGGRRGADRSG
jgi:hypothetical protein